MKQTGYSSSRPHQVLLLSAKDQKLRLQWALAQQHWTREDWNTLPGQMSFDFSCNIQMVGLKLCITNMKAWIGLALYQEFRLRVGSLIIPNEHRLHATVSIAADLVHLSDHSAPRLMDNEPCH